MRHQRLHIAQDGLWLAVDPKTRAPERFDLVGEISSERDTQPGEIMARHLADDGMVSMTVFAGVSQKFGRVVRKRIQSRAAEISDVPEVNFDRVFGATWSAQTPNRSRGVVPNNSWSFDEFNLNPIGLWGHNSDGGPENVISRWLLVGHKTSSDTSDPIGFQELVPAETPLAGEMASAVVALMRLGALNAYSPGFMIGALEFDEDENLVIIGSKDSPNVLVELSNVPVPRHARALRNAVDSGALDQVLLERYIGYQLEQAYSNDRMLIETHQLEAIAQKMGLVNAQAMVQMSAEEIEAIALPGAPEVDMEAAKLQANALRTGELPEGLECDSEAWARFALVTGDDENLPDDTLGKLAKAAGLAEFAEALALVPREEPVVDEPEEPEIEEHAVEPEAPEVVEPEPRGMTVEEFVALASKAVADNLAAPIESMGVLVIPE